MEKIDLMEIAKTIKKLGYKVAINGIGDAVFVGNDKNAICVYYGVEHIHYSLVCKEHFCHINGIGDEITKENIDKALNSDVWKDEKTNPITIEKCLDILNLKFLEDENRPTHEMPNKPSKQKPSPEGIIPDTKGKARDVLLRKMNEAIKEFEDETGIEVISLNSERLEIHYSNGGECDHTFEFKLNAK